MANTVEKVIAIAKNEIGYLEKKTNAQLYDKTANAGSNNYTKYANDIDNIKGYFNGPKNGYQWCAVFVNWCFIQAYGVNTAKSLLCQPASNNYAAGCTSAVQYFKNKSQFYARNPKVGDQIFFKASDGDPGHTGLVYKVDSSKVYTIEGNTSSASGVVANGGAVAYKSYALNSSYIYGYGRPKYDASSTTQTATTTAAQTVANTTASTTTKAAASANTSAVYVKKFQAWLNNNYNCGLILDGDYGKKTKVGAIKALQTYLNKTYKTNLIVDGDFGSKTKAACKQCNLSKGSKGIPVYILQGVLYGLGYDCNGFDGSFGNGCYTAVRKYQAAVKLSADGVVGSNTWSKLFS